MVTLSVPDTPKLYGELASWFHLLSSPGDYAEEADFAHSLLAEPARTIPATLLELGSGGGNNASHMKAHFKMTLVDISDGMLDLSRSLNPECEHIQGDMKSLRLGRVFEAVFIHDSTTGDGRSIRYIEWTFDPDPSDSTYTVDFAYLLRQARGPVRVVHDTHIFGIFPRDTWLRLLKDARFEGRCVADPWGREVFVGRAV